jgi:protocatechuate 3,4-dioxygenase beta subunit
MGEAMPTIATSSSRNRSVSLPAVAGRALGLALLLALFAGAALAATVEVEVLDPDGKAVPGATVTLVPSGRLGITGQDGVVRFEGVPSGAYDAVARQAAFAPFRVDVKVSESGPVSVKIRLFKLPHLTDSITVSPEGRDTFEAYQPATVLGGPDLQQRLANTLGATLAVNDHEKARFSERVDRG